MFFLFLFIILLVFSKEPSNYGTLYLTEKESLSISGSTLIIPSNNSEFNIHKDIEGYQPELILIYRQDIENLFTVLSYDESHIKLCSAMRKKIFCKVNILYELIDGQIQIIKDSLVINTESLCSQMINFLENQYLLVCGGGVYIFNGTLSDMINIQSEFPLKFDYRERQFIIYETETDNSSLLLYQNNEFNNPQQFWISYQGNVGKIIDIQIMNILKILVTFEYLEVILSLNGLYQPTQLIQPNFQVVFRNDIICGINYNLTEQFSYENQILGFSNTSEFPKDVLLIKNMVVMNFKQRTVIFKSLFNFTIESSFKKLISLKQLPFMIAVQDNQCIIYEISISQKFVKNPISQYIYTFVHDVTWPQKYELKKYDFKKPEIIFKKQNTSDFICNQLPNLFQLNFQGIPFKIETTGNFEIKYQYQTSFDSEQENIFLFKENDNIVFLIESKKYIQLNSNENLTNIVFSQVHKSIIHISGSKLTQFKMISQQLKITNLIDFQVEILKYKLCKNYVQLLLSNCSIINYQLFGAIFGDFFYENIFFTECIQSYQSFKTFIQFSPTKIKIFPFQSYRRTYSFTEIFDCDQVKNYRLIIYELINQEVQIKLYSAESFDLEFLFNLPLYNHSIRYPVRRLIQEKYFIIEAIREDQNYLLIYDLQYSAASVLKKIIKIDHRRGMSFNFLEKSIIYYVYDNKIYYELIDKVQLVFNTSVSKYYEKIAVNLTLESLVCCSIVNYSTIFRIVNQRLNLGLGNFQKEQIAHEYQIRKIQISGIIGSINDIKLMTNECNISKPFKQIIDIECYQYHNKSCLNLEKEIIVDIFGYQRILQQHSLIFNLISIQSMSNEEWLAIYQDEKNQIFKQHLFLKELNINKPQSILSNLFYEKVRVKKQVQNLFVLQKKTYQCVIKIKDDEVELLSEDLRAADIIQTQGFQIILQCVFENKTIIVTMIENDQKITEIFIEEIQEEQFILEQLQIHDIFILSATLTDQILSLRYLIVFQQYSAYLFEVQINLIIKQYQLLRLKIIRYGFIGYLSKVFYCSSDLIVMEGYDVGLTNNVFFYDLRNQQEIIDCYHSLVLDGIEGVEKYNETHYVVVQWFKTQVYKTTLVQIEDYSIVCDSKSNINNFNLLLQNSVSELEIVIEYQMLSEGEFNYQILLSIDLIIILIILKCYKKPGKLIKL